MRPIPLNLLTLYADLAQNVEPSGVQAGSITTRVVKGRPYLYATTKDGGLRRQRSLGRADDAKAMAEAGGIRAAAERAKNRRAAVSALKRARVPAPSLPLGKVLEVIANAGLFLDGAVLIGTAAYQTYPCIVGFYLPSAALMTNDADVLVASFMGRGAKQDLETILQAADGTFRAQMSRDDRLPKVFKAANGFQVDVVTKFGPGRKSPVLVPELNCSAEALPFMEYLAEESVDAVALYGAGVAVRAPPPHRYAVHKLLIAQERSGSYAAKKRKDLLQAADLLEVHAGIDSELMKETVEEARARGPKWRKNIDASLREIERAARSH